MAEVARIKDGGQRVSAHSSAPKQPAPDAPAEHPNFALQSYLMCMPEIAREITSCWISAVPSKMS